MKKTEYLYCINIKETTNEMYDYCNTFGILYVYNPFKNTVTFKLNSDNDIATFDKYKNKYNLNVHDKFQVML